MEKKEKKNESNKGLIIIVIVLSLLVVGLGSFFAYDKLLSKPKEKDSVEKGEENKSSKTVEIASKKLFSNNTNSEQIIVNNKTYIVTLELTEINPGEVIHVLKVDGKEIFKGILSNISHSYMNFWSIGDLIAVQHSMTLNFIDLDGVVVKKVDYWDTDVFKMGFALFRADDLISVTNNEIIIKASAIDEANELRLKDSSKSMTLCTESTAEKFNVKDESVVSGTYKFEYLGNNKFSDFKLTEVEETFAKYVESYCDY